MPFSHSSSERHVNVNPSGDLNNHRSCDIVTHLKRFFVGIIEYEESILERKGDER